MKNYIIDKLEMMMNLMKIMSFCKSMHRRIPLILRIINKEINLTSS